MLAEFTPEQQREIFEYLRESFPIHHLEKDFGTRAEDILEAISTGGVLTLRMIRGVIAQSMFNRYVIPQLKGWETVPIVGDPSYDHELKDSIGSVTIQVKLQRLKAFQPMTGDTWQKWMPKDMYIVETWRTRTGTNRATGEQTRYYDFREFDILAVSMHPSTNDWSKFMYTVTDWLLPRPDKPSTLNKYQLVPSAPNDDWTDDLTTCIAWLRSGKKKRVYPRDIKSKGVQPLFNGENTEEEEPNNI